ncbi:velvet factor-domain-containing protein [Mycena vulgaris]|nr:velvet factor-domain-containing protein [Mycena vulgaris]
MDLDGGEAQMAPHTMPPTYVHDRNRLQYELTVRQEPKQARMCGIGGKADRRPIDPPVIVQLRVIDPAAPASPPPDADDDKAPASDRDRDAEPPYANLAGYAQSFLQNPYYFMFASLAKPDDDQELHWLKDGRTRCTTGSVVSSLYALKDPTAPGAAAAGKDGGPTTASPACDAGFFVFPDLSVRTEGSYRLKLSLFEVVGNDVRHCKSIYSAPFYVYTAKKFPGVEGAFLFIFSSVSFFLSFFRLRVVLRVVLRLSCDSIFFFDLLFFDLVSISVFDFTSTCPIYLHLLDTESLPSFLLRYPCISPLVLSSSSSSLLLRPRISSLP